MEAIVSQFDEKRWTYVKKYHNVQTFVLALVASDVSVQNALDRSNALEPVCEELYRSWKPTPPRPLVYGFENGVYLCETSRFYCFPNKDAEHFATLREHEAFKGQICRWETLSDTPVCYKVFPCPFRPRARWVAAAPAAAAGAEADERVPPLARTKTSVTPLDSILAAQHLDDETKFFLCAAIGWSMYGLGHDDLRLALNIHGESGTGKTVITNLVAYLHPESATVALNTQSDDRWGISGVGNKLVVIVGESYRLRMSGEELKKHIVGEQTQQTIPNDGVKSIKPTAMWFFTANKTEGSNAIFKNIRDDGGALSARIAEIAFHHRVANKDTGLERRILSNVGPILDECNRAYRKMLDAIGTKDWMALLSPNSQIRENMLGRRRSEHFPSFVRKCLVVEYSRGCRLPLNESEDFSGVDGRGVRFKKGSTVLRMQKSQQEPGTYDDKVCSMLFNKLKTSFRDYLRRHGDSSSRRARGGGGVTLDHEQAQVICNKVLADQNDDDMDKTKAMLWRRHSIYVRKANVRVKGSGPNWTPVCFGVRLKDDGDFATP